MSEVLSPVVVERAIVDATNRIAKGVRICSDRLEAYRDAQRAYDHAYAVAYMSHEGPAHEKKYAAEIATQGERKVMDAAEVVYRYAEKTDKALQAELMAYQSINRHVGSMYNAAGAGQR